MIGAESVQESQGESGRSEEHADAIITVRTLAGRAGWAGRAGPIGVSLLLAVLPRESYFVTSLTATVHETGVVTGAKQTLSSHA